MTYSEKCEFAARVFEAVLAVRFPAFMGYTQPDEQPWVKIIALLAQAQLDALPSAKSAARIDNAGAHGEINYPLNVGRLNRAYALACKLAPLVGVAVQP